MQKIKFSNCLYEGAKPSVNYIKYVLQNPSAARQIYQNKKLYELNKPLSGCNYSAGLTA